MRKLGVALVVAITGSNVAIGLRNIFGSQSRSLNDPLNNSPTF
jgi:hypothetical protein